MAPKKFNIIYWITTVLFSGLMIFTSVGGLKPTQETIQIFHDGLGYPIYFIVFISYAKIIGSLAILMPGLNKHIKEWAYAGLFFDLSAAVFSGVAVSGKFDPMMLTMLIWIVPGVISYYCWLTLTKKIAS